MMSLAIILCELIITTHSTKRYKNDKNAYISLDADAKEMEKEYYFTYNIYRILIWFRIHKTVPKKNKLFESIFSNITAFVSICGFDKYSQQPSNGLKTFTVYLHFIMCVNIGSFVSMPRKEPGTKWRIRTPKNSIDDKNHSNDFILRMNAKPTWWAHMFEMTEYFVRPKNLLCVVNCLYYMYLAHLWAAPYKCVFKLFFSFIFYRN